MTAAICSGLTVGYLSISGLDLDLKINNGTEEEKKSVILLLYQLFKLSSFFKNRH
jgi:hypothetical protein